MELASFLRPIQGLPADHPLHLGPPPLCFLLRHINLDLECQSCQDHRQPVPPLACSLTVYNWLLWLDWSSSHTTALLTWPDRFEAWEGSLAKHRFLGRGLIRAKLLVESLKSSPAELTFSVSIIAIGTWCLVESSHGTILASSLGPLRTSVLPLVNKSTLSSIPKVAISILLLLHLGHLSSNLRNRVLSEPALVSLNALFHLLSFEAVHNRKIRLDLKT